MKVTRWWRELAALLVGLSVALFAAEGIVRRFAPQDTRIQSPGMYQSDSVTGYRFSANFRGKQSNRVEYLVTIRTDSAGMRIPSDGATTDRPTRVLFIGDSFVFGQGVEAEEALPAQLERALESRGKYVTVLNGGVPGYSTDDEVVWLQRYGFAQEPDVVILGVSLGNDLRDNGRSRAMYAASGEVRAPARRWHSVITTWAFENLHLYALARNIVLRVHATWANGGAPSGADRVALQYVPIQDSLRTRELAVTRAAIAAFDSLLESRGLQGFAVLLPDRVQVEPRRMASLRSRLPANETIDLEYPNGVFRRELEARGIPSIDLTHAFRSLAVRGEMLYFAVDGHATPLGNATAANLVAEEIVTRRGGIFEARK